MSMSNLLTVDIRRCAGCFACTVACSDQNDLEGSAAPVWRTVHKIEDMVLGEAFISYISLGCRHCADAPCLIACPTGAVRREAVTGSIVVMQDLCIGCHICAEACPFNVPGFGASGKMEKCDLCVIRVTQGLEPACVRVCPTKALKLAPMINTRRDL